ncbi:TPA: hypothetical protein ACX6QT_002556 [Photobacterium damselae]
MLTGYWSIDAFLIASLILCLGVSVVFGYQQYTGGGALDDASSKHSSKE